MFIHVLSENTGLIWQVDSILEGSKHWVAGFLMTNPFIKSVKYSADSASHYVEKVQNVLVIDTSLFDDAKQLLQLIEQLESEQSEMFELHIILLQRPERVLDVERESVLLVGTGWQKNLVDIVNSID